MERKQRKCMKQQKSGFAKGFESPSIRISGLSGCSRTTSGEMKIRGTCSLSRDVGTYLVNTSEPVTMGIGGLLLSRASLHTWVPS